LTDGSPGATRLARDFGSGGGIGPARVAYLGRREDDGGGGGDGEEGQVPHHRSIPNDRGRAGKRRARGGRGEEQRAARPREATIGGGGERAGVRRARAGGRVDKSGCLLGANGWSGGGDAGAAWSDGGVGKKTADFAPAAAVENKRRRRGGGISAWADGPSWPCSIFYLFMVIIVLL